jgi:carbonic anhydrase/acetyltransferase-like protein (isoleucine patch superfamily)
VTPTGPIAATAHIGQLRQVNRGIVVEAHAVVSRGCQLGSGAIIGESAYVGHDVTLMTACYIPPREIVPAGMTLPYGFIFSRRAIEFTETVPDVITRVSVAFSKRKSGFMSLEKVAELSRRSPKSVVQYLETMADYPAEAGRQLAACKNQVMGIIPDWPSELLRVFHDRTLLVVLSYWTAETTEENELCDHLINQLCELAIPQFNFTLENFKHENFVPSLLNISESISIMREKGIHEDLITKLKNVIVSTATSIRIKLLLMGCPADSLILAALHKIILSA